MRGTWRGAPLRGTTKDMLSKALEMGVCFHRVRLLVNMEGRSFPRAFQKGKKILYLGKLLFEIWKVRNKKGLLNGQLSP